MDINQGLEFIQECIESLQGALDFFDRTIGRPEFLSNAGQERFRYREPTAQIFQVLKCVKIVSTYNACLCLLREGYVQEGCALIRMILEFLNDIDFIQQGIDKGEMSEAQQAMLTMFFEDDLLTVEQLLSTHAKKPSIARKKIYAEVARGLNPQNPDRTQRIVRILEETYSGYVNGSYPHVMELYVGGSWQFSTEGMANTPRQFQFLCAVIRSLHQALNQFAELAASFGDAQLFEDLKKQRKKLEASKFYGRTQQ